MASGNILRLRARAADPMVIEPLRASYPGLRVRGRIIEVPLWDAAPEEILAACRAAGIGVEGSAVRVRSERRRSDPRPRDVSTGPTP